MIIRTSLLYILGVSIHIGALTAQTQITVTEGSTAELSCTLPDVQNQTPHVLWLCNDKFVFEREGKEFIAGAGYEGRVDVPVEKLSNGDCTLVMKTVSLNDKGEYKTFLRSRGAVVNVIQHVKLVVEDIHMDPFNDGDTQICDVNLIIPQLVLTPQSDWLRDVLGVLVLHNNGTLTTYTCNHSNNTSHIKVTTLYNSPIPTKKTPEQVEHMKLTLTDAAGMKHPHPLMVILCAIISCYFLPHKTIFCPLFE